MGREDHGERLLNKAAVLVALFAVCLCECSYGIYNQKSLLFINTGDREGPDIPH